MSDSETDTVPRASVAFSLPQRRKNAFVSRMRTAAGNKAIIVKISGCQVLSVKSLVSSSDSAQDGGGGGGGSGYLAKILLPADSPATQRMLAMDAEAETAGAEKNAAWFSNNLTPDDMRAMFRASIGASPDGGGNSLLATVLVSDVKEPRPLALDGAELDGSDALAEMSLTAAGRATLRSCQATCVLEAQGLYFYARRFGVRWCLRSLALTSTAAAAAEASAAAALTDDDRVTIESHWAAEVASFGARMDAAAAALQRRKAEAAELLAAAVALPARSEREWNATLDALRRNLYASGPAGPAPPASAAAPPAGGA
jgi:hypothetical protein